MFCVFLSYFTTEAPETCVCGSPRLLVYRSGFGVGLPTVSVDHHFFFCALCSPAGCLALANSGRFRRRRLLPLLFRMTRRELWSPTAEIREREREESCPLASRFQMRKSPNRERDQLLWPGVELEPMADILLNQFKLVLDCDSLRLNCGRSRPTCCCR